MITERAIEVLRQAAKSDEPLRDVLHMFAGKERSFRKGEMSLSGLVQRMNADGFDHDDKKYASVIQKLADAGLGTLDKTPNGKILGLRHVNIIPKTLGKAVLEGSGEAKPAQKRSRYIPAPSPSKASVEQKPIVEMKAPHVAAPTQSNEVMIELKLIIKGQELRLSIPKGMSTQDVATLINKLSS